MIPTASMADIAFLLIIFFMVTTQFHVDRTNVALPNSAYREEVPKGSAYVVIHEDPPNSRNWAYKFSNGDDMSQPVPDLSGMEIEVSNVAATDPTKPFVIKAEGITPYQLIDDVIDMLRRAGVEEIVLLTEQRTVQN
ncbi:MAG: biopolymer transporter ExbD [Acidobacteriota bacterium]|nr:MAG: biopolymer transporter ExbD [Acidobacteriota bacterium]